MGRSDRLLFNSTLIQDLNFNNGWRHMCGSLNLIRLSSTNNFLIALVLIGASNLRLHHLPQTCRQNIIFCGNRVAKKRVATRLPQNVHDDSSTTKKLIWRHLCGNGDRSTTKF